MGLGTWKDKFGPEIDGTLETLDGKDERCNTIPNWGTSATIFGVEGRKCNHGYSLGTIATIKPISFLVYFFKRQSQILVITSSSSFAILMFACVLSRKLFMVAPQFVQQLFVFSIVIIFSEMMVLK